ncbi:MAG: hypothetical protein Q8865_02000 [Bacillota bacterium]|nr:hypothetical protein [Bacillota bacterium]
MKKKADDFLLYRGKPLVRCGDIIYYGSISDDYVIMMQVLDTKDVDGKTTAGKVHVELQRTSTDIPAKDRVIKKAEKDGLYNALDVASIWLTRALAE